MQLSKELRDRLVINFAKCVQGYHIVNSAPIKESPWEDINATILHESGCVVHTQSNGSHASGADITCGLGKFSNKSALYNGTGTGFDVSSYRLTSVCSDKVPGTVETICAEINRRKNFDFYSILVRTEVRAEDACVYDWYLIPSDCVIFNPNSYTWRPKLGKSGKSKDAVVGWETDMLHGSRMSITFSMSSQLWIHVNATNDLKQYIIGSCRVQNGRKYNYIQLHDRLYNE